MLEGNRLRESYEGRIDRLRLPYRFTTGELRDAIAAHRGKVIVLRSLDTMGISGAPCGVRLETPHADLVFYEKNASVHHQRHILTHELMHVYVDHSGSLEVDASTARAVGVNPAGCYLRGTGSSSVVPCDLPGALPLGCCWHPVRLPSLRIRPWWSMRPTTSSRTCPAC